jgi:Flp pilus assembly pilin Flp
MSWGSFGLTLTTLTGVKSMPLLSSRLTLSGKEAIMDLIGKFSGDESGATAVEYTLMLMCIALAIFAAVTTFSTAVHGLFELANARFPSGG